MVIYLPQQSSDEAPLLDELTPREIVAELDKHVVGQGDAKRSVAIALRNRVRRQKLEPEMAEEVMPKNILMIGPTGVGKTEIARRLAKLANSPFLKVEASKFTEVGYVGRDVESIIRDLVDVAIDMVREERLEQVADRAEQQAEDRLLDLLMPPQPESAESIERTREKLREKLRAGKLDDRTVEVDVKERGPTFEVSTNGNIEEMDINLKDVIPGLFGPRTKKRKMRVSEAPLCDRSPRSRGDRNHRPLLLRLRRFAPLMNRVSSRRARQRPSISPSIRLPRPCWCTTPAPSKTWCARCSSRSEMVSRRSASIPLPSRP